SSSKLQILPPWCSPSASNRTAARSGPRSGRLGGAACVALPARLASALAISLCAASCCFESFLFGAAMGLLRGGAVVQPWTDDGNSFARIFVGELADLLHGLGVDLALDLGDVDHLCCLVRFCRLGGIGAALRCERRDGHP